MTDTHQHAPGDRVLVRGLHRGHVRGVPQEGVVYVVLDGGTSGSFPAEAVTLLADKSWPPGGMETKRESHGT